MDEQRLRLTLRLSEEDSQELELLTIERSMTKQEVLRDFLRRSRLTRRIEARELPLNCLEGKGDDR